MIIRGGPAVVPLAALLALSTIPAAVRAQPPPKAQHPASATRPTEAERSGAHSEAASQPASAPASRPSADAATGQAGPRGPREILRDALDLYVAGRYRAAARLLRPLVEQRELEDRADHREALRAYGISLFLSGARAGARRAFRALLRIEPDAKLDPSFVRPEVVAFFEQVKRSYRAEMDAVVARSAPGGSALVNLLPPWGQFQNGHKIKGFVLLSAEVATIAACITTGALLYSWRDSHKRFIGHESAARPLDITNKITFGLALGLVAYGIIDGLYYYFRHRKARLKARGHPATVTATAGGALLRF